MIEEFGISMPLIRPGAAREGPPLVRREMAENLVDAIEPCAGSRQSVEGSDLVHIVENRASLIALVKFKPVVATKLIDRVTVVLVANQLPLRGGVKASELQDVDDSDCPNAVPYLETSCFLMLGA